MGRKWEISTDITEKEIRVLETEITHFVNINIPGVIFQCEAGVNTSPGC